ncbi:exodeoxyribonuclease I subunit D [Fusobacterium naviforme]|nr:exonuclease subunit SbcD [Fusobacterium naviforme]PSL10222.1 exodeoxyribonuclease I subunit D [Fusobacterium naviforme]STO27632.1 Nuclease sbcCD subunit D [Fusobacterium naviforme]
MTNGIRVLHTGDWHIGNFPGPEKDGENVRFRDIVSCLEEMSEKAQELKPDIIIVAGDIFHQARVWSDRGLKENQTAVRIIRQMEAVAPVVVMRGTPNHDSEEQFKSLKTAFAGDYNVHIVTEPGIETYHTYDGKKVQVACVPGFDRGYYRAKNPGLSKEEENGVFTKAVADIIVGLKAQAEPETPAVLVSHFTITGCNMESGQTAFFSQFEPVVYPDTLVSADYDLVCFGHIHRPQQLDGCKNTFYCGAVSALNFNDEGQRRGFYTHDITEGGVTSEFHSLSTREYKTIRLNDDDIKEINERGPEWLYQLPLLEQDEAKDKVVRVLYDCTDEHNKAFNHALLENWLYETGGAFWVQEITPQKISITVDRKSMDAENTPEDNLREWLLDNGRTPEDAVEILNLARPLISEATEKATTERYTGTFVPMEIEVKNYRNYKEEAFSFDDIRFCTINGSNGVGKSSLFMDAMADALFEETREGELTGWIRNDPEARSGAIKFTFKLGERTYRVTRTRQKSGKATLNIAELVDGEWVDRSKEKFKDTQAEIINIIGMDSLTLKACALIMQDQYGLFLQADKEARMNILGSILGLGIYGDMEELAAGKATDTNREIRLLEERAATITTGLPDRAELEAAIGAAEAEKKANEEAAAKKEAEVDGLKVALNTQLEAAARVIKLNSRITTLTATKAAKEGIRTTQTALVTAADAVLAEEPEITAGVAKYAELLEQEKSLIAGKATYDNLTARKGQMETAVKTAQTAGTEFRQKKAAIELTQIAPLKTVIARAAELEEKHREYDEKQNALEAAEAKLPEYQKQKAALTDAKEVLAKLGREYDAKAGELRYIIDGLRGKVTLLDNSGCPNPENAHCKFLADALEAKNKLPEAEKELAGVEETYQKASLAAQEALREAEQALSDNLHIEEEIDALRAKIHGLAQAEKDYQQLEATRQSLATLEERAAELESRIAETEETAAKATIELEAIEAELAATAAGLEAYERLQQEINAAKVWTLKEKQLPAAREKKEAALQRLGELAGEIEAVEAEIEETKLEISVEQAKTVGVEELKAQAEAAEQEIRAAQQAAQQAAMKIGGLKKQLEEAEEKLNRAAEIQKQVNELGVKAAAYDELKKAFSQDGIPHNVIRSIIPIFEATATNILGQMSQGHMSVEFVTEKVLKSNSKKEVTTLDIIINDSDTGRLPYMSRSGGERVKAALSVILALAEIKSSKAGVQLGFLFIDEPPFLDQPGVQAYCDALEAIQRRYGDLKVMAITHDPAMKSRFPQSVDVVKTVDGSKVIYE